MYIVTSKDEYEGDLGEDSIRDAVSCKGVSINVGLIYICIHIYMYIRYNIMVVPPVPRAPPQNHLHDPLGVQVPDRLVAAGHKHLEQVLPATVAVGSAHDAEQHVVARPALLVVDGLHLVALRSAEEVV